ncbi:9570_t:CDS:2 [Acaulospora colombiana]|uniref:9570_t:CDS:1 n=1 Tax=Acaulospora colombiana TaxID=27376 RepID=A0ACA9LBJ2_9GLOM|nr:9570_t:CDS:2 [Acaulospora colombiana]
MSEAATAQDNSQEAQQADFKQGGTPEKATSQEPEEEEQASETLYIQNLNDKVKLAFVDVVAHRNLRMRGQAFVSFLTTDVAQKAMKEVNKFPLYGKPMQITFAKTRSEAVVKALSPAEFEAFHVERIKQKKRSRWDNPVRKKLKMKKDALATGVMPDTGAAGPRRPTVQMPDEYLPPNKILFVQNLPQDITKEALMLLFSPYKKDIAFIEYADEGSATVAKDALHNSKLGEGKIKKMKRYFYGASVISFGRQFVRAREISLLSH